MAKLRLSAVSRGKLIEYAQKLIAAPAEAATLAAAYETAATLVRRTVEAVYPPKDMAVCRKYEAAQIDDCIKLRLTAGGVEQFVFATGTGPLVVKPTYTGKIYDADAETTDAVVAWVTARDAHTAALKAKLSDYRSLVIASRTIEAVAEIWPEAAALREQLEPKAIVALGPEVIGRIQQDVAARADAA